MKRFLCIMMIVTLILTTTFYSFADQYENKNVHLCLTMTSSEEDIAFLKSASNVADSLFDSSNNSLQIDFSKIITSGDKVNVDGLARITMYGEDYTFAFSDQVLEKKDASKEILYWGVIEFMDENNEGFLDLTVTKDFKQAVGNLTLINLETEEERLMFYGDTFGSQKEVFAEEQKLINEKDLTEQLETQDISFENNNSKSLETRAAGDTLEYTHITNKSTKVLAGSTTGKQMLVVNYARYRPTSASVDGRTRIRVFTRTYNVREVLGITGNVTPYKLYVKFVGDNDEMYGPVTTTPSGSGSDGKFSISNIYSVISKNAEGQRIVTAIETLIKSVAKNNSSSIDVNGTTATFNLILSGVSISGMNLPKGTNSSDAELNTENGLVLRVKYGIEDLTPENEIDVSVSMTYRIYDENDRAYTKKTGTITHNYSI